MPIHIYSIFKMYLNPWVLQKFPSEIALNFKIYRSDENGNCFFDSVRIIQSQTYPHITIGQLRALVASPVRDISNVIVTETLHNWIELYQGAEREKDIDLIREFQHVSDVTLPLTDRGRQHIFDMMMKSSYWGEQHACRIIEETFNIRFLIFDGDSEASQVNQYYSKSYGRNHLSSLDYCFLYKHNHHFMPISYKDKFKWKWENLPREVQLFFSPQVAK
jgi:hypothetical protein